MSRLAALCVLEEQAAGSLPELDSGQPGSESRERELAYRGLGTHTTEAGAGGPGRGAVPDGNVVHDFAKHGR